MKRVELKHTLRMLTKVCADPRIGQTHGEQLRRAKMEIENVLGSGKVDEARLYRIVESIATILLESLDG